MKKKPPPFVFPNPNPSPSPSPHNGLKKGQAGVFLCVCGGRGEKGEGGGEAGEKIKYYLK